MATIDYLLSIPKLQRLLLTSGNGKNALIISLEQTSSGEFQVMARFDKVKIKEVPVTVMRPAEPDGSEKLCPVPPGCDSNGNCYKTLSDHMIGSTEAYTITGDSLDKLNNNEEMNLTITPES